MSMPFFNIQQIAADISILCFLGTVFTLLASALGVLVLLLAGRRRWAKWLVSGAAAGAGLYVAALMGFSLLSREQVLGAKWTATWRTRFLD